MHNHIFDWVALDNPASQSKFRFLSLSNASSFKSFPVRIWKALGITQKCSYNSGVILALTNVLVLLSSHLNLFRKQKR